MIITLDIDLSALPKEKIQEGKNGHKYIKLTAATMRNPDKWGNDFTVFAAQSKEERAAKADKQYVGKGKTFGEEKRDQQPDLPITRGNLMKGDLPF